MVTKGRNTGAGAADAGPRRLTPLHVAEDRARFERRRRVLDFVRGAMATLDERVERREGREAVRLMLTPVGELTPAQWRAARVLIGGMTVQDASAAAGIEPAALVEFESGFMWLPPAVLRRLGKAYGLCGREGE